MKASKVLLRWYKSFNVNYTQYQDHGAKTTPRPWNTLHLDKATEADLPFIEIPLESDITTVVGANESGKSHLLSAISKVITGHGLKDARGQARDFSRTDLCHYSSIRSKNADVWPHIGLEFSQLSQADAVALGKAITGRSWQPNAGGKFTLIVAPKDESVPAFIYADNVGPEIPLDKAQLSAVRKCLPQVLFIQSRAELSDDIHLADILSHFESSAATSQQRYYPFDILLKAAETLLGISADGNNQLSPKDSESLTATKALFTQGAKKRLAGHLEADLFRVLGIEAPAIEFLAGLGDQDRSYAESLVETWNDEIDKTLNLSLYWQQDDQFRIRMNYKRGTIYFEITDKTKAVYTFQERSSGLKYFLSYYIQAKAIQQATRDQNCIILMDEPDSFLSITGQRNLLAVFESLVSADSSLRNAQLLYTTHSPFLINRNFPRRIRLVRKGDAEEGTQYVGACHVRRYEPIRSALGIDCAQTLFMGATNLIVEGTTDQYVISELVRYFATPDNIAELLDLNSIVLTSADGAGGPEQLLSASTWGDEPRPATVVALDDDSAGHKSRDRITGVEKGAAQLILPEFVVLISEAVPHTAAELHTIVTIEDVFPIPIYAEAIRSYFKRWYDTDLDADFTTAISEGLFGKMGLVEDTQKVFDRILGDARSGYDKMGVLREAVALLGESKLEEETKSLRARFFGFCAVLREKIAASEHAQQIRSGKQAIKQLIREFFVIHKESSMLFDVGVLIGRLVSEAEQLGTDGTNLAQLLTEWREEIKKMRAADQKRLAGVAWTQWTQRFELLKRDPFNTAALRGDTQELSQVSSKTIVERESAISKQPVPLVGATPAADTQTSM